MKDIAFTCPITQEYVHDLLNETFDYQNITVFKGKDEKYNWIYMIINKTNGHFFIGTRSKSNLLNSINIARQPELKADVERLGANAFSRFDLSYYQTYEEMMSVAADQFGDEFISVFSELGTCYNARPIEAEFKADEDIKVDEIIKADEDVKADENNVFYQSLRYHHIMKKDNQQLYVANEECLSFLENGFRFVSSQISIFRLNDFRRRYLQISPKNHFKGQDYELYERARNLEIAHLLRSGWELSSEKICLAFRHKKRLGQQLTLNFEKDVEKDFSEKSVVPRSQKTRSSYAIILHKDDDVQAVLFDDIKSYLAQGYYYLGLHLSLTKDGQRKHITFKSKSKNPFLSDLNYAKMRSKETLHLLENGWKFEKK